MVVRNTDGHQLAMLEDQYRIAKGSFASAFSRLAAIDGTLLDAEGKRSSSLTFTRPGNAVHADWKNTILGTARITSTRLTVSTNSRERADALKAEIAQRLTGVVSWSKRNEQPLPRMRGGEEMWVDGQASVSPSVSEAYRSWLDASIPALEGRTPREAIIDSEGRGKVHQLLKELENTDARSEEAHEPSGSQLRRELGMNELGELDQHRDLDRTLGSGRKISETILAFAKPLLDLGTDEPGMKAALHFATTVWNLVVAEEHGVGKGAVATGRALIKPGDFPLEMLKSFDELVARKRERFAGDLRQVGHWTLKRSAGHFGVEMQAVLPAELIAQAKAAGLKP